MRKILLLFWFCTLINILFYYILQYFYYTQLYSFWYYDDVILWVFIKLKSWVVFFFNPNFSLHYANNHYIYPDIHSIYSEVFHVYFYKTSDVHLFTSFPKYSTIWKKNSLLFFQFSFVIHVLRKTHSYLDKETTSCIGCNSLSMEQKNRNSLECNLHEVLLRSRRHETLIRLMAGYCKCGINRDLEKHLVIVSPMLQWNLWIKRYRHADVQIRRGHEEVFFLQKFFPWNSPMSSLPGRDLIYGVKTKTVDQ